MSRIKDVEEEVQSFSLKQFLILCLANWKWFVIAIIFCVGVALFYLVRKEPVYERSEEILIKDNDGGGFGGMEGMFAAFNPFGGNTKVYNELISFTSPAVMFEVVDRLNLTMSMTQRNGLKRKTLYGTSEPVEFTFPDLGPKDAVGFQIIIQPDGSYKIRKMWRWVGSKRVKFPDEATGKVGGSPVGSPLGKINVAVNDAYIPSPDDAGKEMIIDVLKMSRQGAVEKYSTLLKGDLADQDADVIRLSIDDTSVQRADDILNTVVNVYNERWIEDKNKVSVASNKFITDRLLVIEKELGHVDDQIADQKSSMRVPDVMEAAKGIMEQNFRIDTQLLEITNQLAMTKYLKEYLQNGENAYSIIPMNTGSGNQVLEQQIGSFNQLLLARNNLAENSSDQNPVVKDYNKQLAGLRTAIINTVNGYIASLESALKNVKGAQNANKGELSASPQQAKMLLSVERQQLVMQELYIFLLQKREENELSQAFTVDNTRIITPPYGKTKPVSPKKALILVVSVILGLGIPAGILFLLDASDAKVRSRKDVENLKMPFAGEIPQIGKTKAMLNAFRSKKSKRKEIDKPKVVVEEGKRDIPNEAFRVVRSNLDFMSKNGEHPVIALTSFNPGSGKSFVAYNLGYSYSLKGKRVLLIDGDLRHASISAYVNNPRKGLTSYLNGTCIDWQELVVAVPDSSNYDILPIGNRPPNPAELLENGRLGALIDEAKNAYDVILIDCPPVNIVVDTQLINQYVTRTLFVVRAGLLEKKGVADLDRLVEDEKLKNVTVLLNGTSPQNSSFHTYGNYEAIDKI